MTDAGAADEWEVVVPEDDAELLAELRRHGVQPGQRLKIRNSGKYRSAATGRYVTKSSASSKASHTMRSAKVGRHGTAEPGDRAEKRRPTFFGSVRSGQRDLAERSQEILRAEFPGE